MIRLSTKEPALFPRCGIRFPHYFRTNSALIPQLWPKALLLLFFSAQAFAGPATLILTPDQCTSLTAQCGAVPPIPPVIQPGTGWNGTCAGFTNTRVLPMSWSSPARLYTASFGGMGANDAVVVTFTVGNVSTTSSLPRIAGAEFNSSPSSRTATLSAVPCDFSVQPTPGASILGNSVTAVFAIGTGSGFNYYPVLAKNGTYYLNVRNTADATCTGTGACDMFFDLVKVGGL